MYAHELTTRRDARGYIKKDLNICENPNITLVFFSDCCFNLDL